MRDADGEAFEMMLSAVSAIYGRELSRDILLMYWSALAEYDIAAVRQAFDRHDTLKDDVPRNHFVVGINDDVCGTSLAWDPAYENRHEGVYSALFYGLASDGTVGANKNSIKIIGEKTDNNVQAFFVYDSKKAGTVTTSHLRFGRETIRSPYLVDQADFVACHNFTFLERYDMLSPLKQGGVFLLNSPYSADEVWDQLPRQVQQQIIDKQIRFYAIDAYKTAAEIGLGPRINTIMQAACHATGHAVDGLGQSRAEIAREAFGTKALKFQIPGRFSHGVVHHIAIASCPNACGACWAFRAPIRLLNSRLHRNDTQDKLFRLCGRLRCRSRCAACA